MTKVEWEAKADEMFADGKTPQEINKVIVGVDSVKHLKDILKFRKKNYLNFSFLKSNEANLITPSRWQKL